MKTKTPWTDQLAGLREQAVSVRAQAREAQLAHQRAVEDVERLREARVKALTAEDEETAARLQTERDEAERTAVDLADRSEAALRAVQGAESEQGAYAAQHLSGLLAERRTTATAAAEDIEHAIGELTQAATRWHNEQAAVVELLRIAGQSTHGLPTLPAAITDLIRASRRTSGEAIPPPMHLAERTPNGTAA